jgi:hypothetical protein
MNSLTAIAPVITADHDALRRDFPLKPFAIHHKLSGHPLLTLPRIAQLASELPRDLIEYNSGKVAISQDPDAIPSVDLDPVEVVKSIETAGAWMVLKRVENSPEYRRLLEDTLLSVARARGFNSLLDAGFEQVEGFLFVSSPNSTRNMTRALRPGARNSICSRATAATCRTNGRIGCAPQACSRSRWRSPGRRATCGG